MRDTKVRQRRESCLQSTKEDGAEEGEYAMWSLTQGFKDQKKMGLQKVREKEMTKSSTEVKKESQDQVELRVRREARETVATSPVSPHALLWGTELMARRRKALSPIPVIVPIFTPTAALPATVPLSGNKNE